MLKSTIKEIFIILLLSIAILLVLAILFYDYIPINKVIPEREAYVTPENVKNELNENITESEKIEVTYEVTDSDLNVYKQTGGYKEGKKNPFSLTKDTDTNSDTNANTGTNENLNNNSETTIDENSTGTFFNNEGIK